MDQNSLIYVCELDKPETIIGCGVMIEGPSIATCRHVWTGAKGEENNGVSVLFPFFRADDGKILCEKATLKDPFEYETPLLDIVLLGVTNIPNGLHAIPLATEAKYEIGAAVVHTYLGSRQIDVIVNCNIDQPILAHGFRQISGVSADLYWTETGSSGSPLFQKDSSTLAGILSLSEVGEKRTLQAFVIPATKIRDCLVNKQKEAVSEGDGPVAGKIETIVPGLDTAKIPLPKIQQTIQQAFDAIKRKSKKDLSKSGKNSDFDEAKREAAKRLAEFDTDAALDIWERLLTRESQGQSQDKEKKIAILNEEVNLEELRWNYESARSKLYEIVQLEESPYQTWARIGELELYLGTVEKAIPAFSAALQGAKIAKNERDMSACQIMLADAHLQFGDADEALKLSEDALGVRRKLYDEDTSDLERSRDLFVALQNAGRANAKQNGYAAAAPLFDEALTLAEEISTHKNDDLRSERDLAVILSLVGDARRQNENFAGAREVYDKSLAIFQRLLSRKLEQPALLEDHSELRRDILISLGNVGDMYYSEGDTSKASDSYKQSLDISRRLFAETPGDKVRQIDVANCANQLAKALRATEDLKGAISNIEEGLVIRKRLLNTDPKNGELSHDICKSLTTLASAKLQAGEKTAACEDLAGALSLILPLTVREPENHSFKRTLENINYEISQSGCP